MKKIAIFLMMLLPMLAMVSCDDKDSIPNVTVTVDLNNVVDYQGNLYAVMNDTLSVTAVDIQGNNNKKALIAGVDYGWDYRFVGTNPFYPFGVNLMMLNPGNHLLSMKFEIAQVDKSISVASIQIPIKVVESVDSLPAGTSLGATSLSYIIN